MAAKTQYYSTGGGELKFTPIVNGVMGTESDFGQTEDIKFNTTIERITHDSTEEAITFEDRNVLKKVSGKLTIDTIEISPDMLAKAYMGNLDTVHTDAATGTKVSVHIDTLGVAYDVGTKFLSNVSVTNSDDSTTYVEGTDYTMDYKKGFVTAIDGGGISAGDDINVTFDNKAYNDYNLEAFKNNELIGKLVFIGKASSGLSYKYTFHKVSLTSSGDSQLKNTTAFGKLSFEGQMLVSEFVADEDASKLFKIEATELLS